MTKEILNKVNRFVELSKEFTISSYDAYEGYIEQPVYNNICYTTGTGDASIYSTGTGKLHISNTEIKYTPPTKIEQYEKSLQEKLEKAKRYEEYLELQRKLSEYFRSLDKLSEDNKPTT